MQFQNGREKQIRSTKEKRGAERKPLAKRLVLEGIFYALRTGCQWKPVPKEHGAGSSIHKYFQEWGKTGFWGTIWAKGLEKYDELEGIGWEWQGLDGSMVKVPLVLEAVGRNPTVRGKWGQKEAFRPMKRGFPSLLSLMGPIAMTSSF